MMTIAIGSDERTRVTDAVISELERFGYTSVRFGALIDSPAVETSRWPNVAVAVARSVASGKFEMGILFCWTGTGVCIAANKIHGVRAALCTDAETARSARRWNDANVLVMGLRLTSETIAKEILAAWFSAAPDTDPETQTCLRALATLDSKR